MTVITTVVMAEISTCFVFKPKLEHLRDKSFFVVNAVTAFCPLKEKSLNTRPDIHDQQSFIIHSLLKSLSYGLRSQRILCSKVDHDIYLKRT